MRQTRTPAATSTCLERIDGLPIDAASRDQARVELEHAEASLDRMLDVVDRLRQGLHELRHAFIERRQRLDQRQ